MSTFTRLNSPEDFAEALYAKMRRINAGIADLELFEFRYALENLYPEQGGWESVKLDKPEEIDALIQRRDFYESIEMRPRRGDRIVLDETIARLSRMLFVGLVEGKYTEEWVQKRFYFDLRGFYFLTRTVYFTEAALAHLGGKSWRSFEQYQKRLERFQGVGYRDFREANAEVDAAFIECVMKIIAAKGTPTLLALAGPTAAGKTEIVTRLQEAFRLAGQKITTIEMDNFLIDLEVREKMGMGREAIHYGIFRSCMEEILKGRKVSIPRYDFIYATSSHDLDGNLRPGCTPIEVEPADILFIEGNFPFHTREIAQMIGLKIVYLTDDPIRLKRKWKRDIDYRKKYDPAFFRNRYFRTQFLRAQDIYQPLIEVCDIVVDTTGAALWVTPEISGNL